MADVTIRASIDELSRMDLKAMSASAVARAISAAERDINEYWKSIAPVSSPNRGWKDVARYGPRGRLRDEFIVSTTMKSIHMIWPTPYAEYADEGTPPHIIFGNPYLRFFWLRGGGWVNTPQIQHPGYTGHRFSDHMRIVAPQFLRQRIIEELQRITP
jgi:hypothetical protein